jgi:hypothetical protein
MLSQLQQEVVTVLDQAETRGMALFEVCTLEAAHSARSKFVSFPDVGQYMTNI